MAHFPISRTAVHNAICGSSCDHGQRVCVCCEGKTGTVVMDDNGDRIGDYTIWQLPKDGGHYDKMLDIRMTQPPSQVHAAGHIHS